MTIDITIVADQEAFLVDAPTPTTPPHRWIQAKAGQALSVVATEFSVDAEC